MCWLITPYIKKKVRSVWLHHCSTTIRRFRDQKKIRDLLSECSSEYESAVVNKIPYRFVLDLVKEYGGKKQFVAISSLDRKRMDRILDSWGLDGVFIDDYRLSAHGSSKQGMIRDLGNHLSCQGIEIRTDNVLVFAGSEDLLKGVYEQGYDCVGIEHSWNRGRIWHCNAILSDNLVTGLFLGMSALDIAYYLPGEPPPKAPLSALTSSRYISAVLRL